MYYTIKTLENLSLWVLLPPLFLQGFIFKMPNPNPKKPISHGFYADGFLCCENCPLKESCTDKESFKDRDGIARCIREKDFFESTIETVKEQFQLDDKDIFQLPQMIMNMIKLKRMNRWQADKGLSGKTILFNPKTGAEHKMDTPGVLNRDTYYAQKALLAFFDSLRLSRSSRDAKDGIDVLAKMMMGQKK